jgi:hypothetical protein
VLGGAGLGLAVRAAFAARGLGDYAEDGGTALTPLLHGDLHAYWTAHPAMGDLSLLVRAPFAALAYLGDPTPLAFYRWGVLPCVASVALLGLWLARIARARGVDRLGQLLIVVLAVANPLTTSAIQQGHPEELLTASLCVGALVAACAQRCVLTGVLLGLALACKQWSVVAVLPVLFALERGRARTLLGALALAALVTAPEVLGAPATFLRNQLALAREHSVESSSWSWWWPLTPSSTRYLTYGGATHAVTLHRLPEALVQSLHSLIIVLDTALALLLARLRGLPLRRDDAFALLAAVLLLRCTLDTETMPYYHAALYLDLLAWDALSTRRLPLRALAGAALSWALFDRFTASFLGVWPSSLLYGAATALIAVALARSLALTATVMRPAARAGVKAA